jgi:UDP-hydrolysing UDP-N-acetyl-D-glucosamine 2-epimerase
MNIPLVHIQGGEVTGNIDEKVRHAITKLADYHFVASESAKERVIRLGENPKMIFNTGCPSIDLAANVAESPAFNFDPIKKYGGVGNTINSEEDYLVVMQHPVTTEHAKSRLHVNETLTAIHELGMPTFWFWPNVDAGADGTSGGIRTFREKHPNSNIHFFKNMEPQDFLRLLVNSRCLIGNSSVGIRECAYLGVPVVNIGSRQNKRDRGCNVIDVDYYAHAIKTAIQTWLKRGGAESSSIYGGGNAGENIANLLIQLPLIFHKTIEY